MQAVRGTCSEIVEWGYTELLSEGTYTGWLSGGTLNC